MELFFVLFPLIFTSIALRRQLYSFYTGSGQGLEAFFTPEGSLVVASAHKKDFWATKVEDSLLGDEEWHSLTVCQVRAKRN